MAIPPRKAQVEDKDTRFYVVTSASEKLQLHQEALQRGTDLWTLGGAVLSAWLRAGCPDFSDFAGSSSPAPSPSSSVADHE